jgi:GT2 family glycosyltransferase
MSQPPSPQVDVVIVAHNAGDLLRAAVDSAAEQAGADHVWVMDAESTDGSTVAIAGSLPQGHVCAVPNAGFSASNNRGIELTSGPFVLLLNPDAVLGEGAVTALLESAERNPRAGIIGPAVYNPDGSAQANAFGRFPTLGSAIELRLWRLAQRARGNTRLSPTIPVRTAPVDWVTGACMLVRRAAIQSAGLMDERFFLYWEDVEWCHRMRDNGWQVLVEPAASLVHHLGTAATPSGVVAQAYGESLDRYCDLYGRWGLKAFIGAGRPLRGNSGGGRS